MPEFLRPELIRQKEKGESEQGWPGDTWICSHRNAGLSCSGIWAWHFAKINSCSMRKALSINLVKQPQGYSVRQKWTMGGGMWTEAHGIENPKDSIKKLINEFSRVSRYKIIIQKSVAFVYTNNELSENKCKPTLLFNTIPIKTPKAFFTEIKKVLELMLLLFSH